MKWVRRRKTNTMWYHLYVESKILHKWTYLRKRNRLKDIENRLLVAKGEGEGMDWKFGVNKGKLLYSRLINNKDLLHSAGNYIQYPMVNHNGKEFLKKNVKKKWEWRRGSSHSQYEMTLSTDQYSPPSWRSGEQNRLLEADPTLVQYLFCGHKCN